MQLYFSTEESNLLAEILLKQGDPAGLLGRASVHDLRFDFDELDQLREILVANWSNITQEIDACGDPQARHALEVRQGKLESMIERVSEACATL